MACCLMKTGGFGHMILWSILAHLQFSKATCKVGVKCFLYFTGKVLLYWEQ